MTNGASQYFFFLFAHADRNVVEEAFHELHMETQTARNVPLPDAPAIRKVALQSPHSLQVRESISNEVAYVTSPDGKSVSREAGDIARYLYAYDGMRPLDRFSSLESLLLQSNEKQKCTGHSLRRFRRELGAKLSLSEWPEIDAELRGSLATACEAK